MPNVWTDRAGDEQQRALDPVPPEQPLRRAARSSATSRDASTSPSRSNQGIAAEARVPSPVALVALRR